MQLGFKHAALSALGIALPEREISSLEIEARLAPLYARLGLAEGRLELMTGIRARRHFARGVLPSDIAVAAAEDLFSRCPEKRAAVDCLIYASVCRNFVEPATATVVHQQLRLSRDCLVFDLSNACLSWMNAVVLAATLIDGGRTRSVLIVSGEDARAVVDNTIQTLNADATLTRQQLKSSLATLTLGSGGAAGLVEHESGARILGGAFSAATDFHALCQGEGLRMETDSETMLVEGVRLAAENWRATRAALEWTPATPARYFTHQVGRAHSKLMMEKLELDPARDFSTFDHLGNMGATSVPATLALGARAGVVADGDPVALLGIGSGLVCGMLGLKWSKQVSV